MLTLITHHGDGTRSTAEHEGDVETILASVREVLETPAFTDDRDAIVGVSVRHHDHRGTLVLGLGAF